MHIKTTALILVGFQNDYFAVDGILRPVIEDQSSVDEVMVNTIAFIRRTLPLGLAVIATPIVLTPDYRALASPVGILNSIKEAGAFTAGTAGADNVPELAEFGDNITYVTGKVGFNAFSNTTLQKVLHEKGIKDVLIAGMVTSLCINSTGRAAYERGFDVTILSDCTSARTGIEQAYYCQNVFPLYGSARSTADVLADLLEPVT